MIASSRSHAPQPGVGGGETLGRELVGAPVGGSVTDGDDVGESSDMHSANALAEIMPAPSSPP